MSKHDEVVNIAEEPQKVTIKYGIGTLLFRTLLAISFLGVPVLIAGAVSYADKHNDERYISHDRYEADQRLDALKEQELKSKLAAIEALIREQSTDIKALIREPRK